MSRHLAPISNEGYNFGENLRMLMDETLSTAAQLGAYIERERKTVYHYYTHGSLPELDVAIKICKYFEIDIADMLKEDGWKKHRMNISAVRERNEKYGTVAKHNRTRCT